MKNLIRIKIKKFFRWIFAEELRDMKKHITDAEAQVAYQRYKSDEIKRNSDKLMNVLGGIDVSVDVQRYAPSWACISIQGKTDYVKFVNLGERDLREISRFLSRFDRTKVDAAPHESKFLKMESKQFKGF
jgi:hypothetical protein